MAQTLNGSYKPNYADSYAVDVGTYRHATGNYNFTDDTGAAAAYTIFTVTGDVLLSIFGLCQVSCTSGGVAKIELGIVGNTAALIAQTTATELIQYEIWEDATPTIANPGLIDLFGGARQFVVAAGVDIILTISAADLTAGDIDFHAFWMPLSADGNIVPA